MPKIFLLRQTEKLSSMLVTGEIKLFAEHPRMFRMGRDGDNLIMITLTNYKLFRGFPTRCQARRTKNVGERK